ncbi:hypothetical protein A0H81_01317 [Grifola frondosa]|uniref:Uncharacterized protein n=1 Tax=Grifola frondosa TaxID=5627 RepID=A0A1C7MVB8_GRIFR|nr:hypothetical protein A0H81_01317 [Grifola frondosa]
MQEVLREFIYSCDRVRQVEYAPAELPCSGWSTGNTGCCFCALHMFEEGSRRRPSVARASAGGEGSGMAAWAADDAGKFRDEKGKRGTKR